MLLDLFVILIVACAAIAVVDWRWGLRLALVVGAIQDPVRKLSPGASPLLAIASLPVWVAAMIGLWRSDPRALARFQRAYPRLSRMLKIFLITLIPPVLVVFLYGLSAWRLAVFGVFAYVAPLGLAVVGFSLVRQERDLVGLLRFYAVFVALMLIGTPLEYSGAMPDWPALGTKALGFVWMRYVPDIGALALISGFYRSPDLMGWHAATLTMVSLTLALRRSAVARGWLLLAIWGGMCVLMAGRRKVIMMPAVWVLVMVLAYMRSKRMAPVISLVGILGLAGLGFVYVASDVVTEHYYSYAASSAREGPDRLFEGAVGSVWMTFLQSGVLGSGIGTVSQGMAYAGVAVDQGWQESGPSRVLAELGLPGFVVGLMIVWLVVRACYGLLSRAPSASPVFHLQVSLVALVAANVACFVVSHQIYTDLSVMPLAALILGLALSGPRWCQAPLPAPRAQPVPRVVVVPRPGMPEVSA